MCSISSFYSISLCQRVNSEASFKPISIYTNFSAFIFSSLSIKAFSLLSAATFSLTSAWFFVKSGTALGLKSLNLCSFVSSFSLSYLTLLNIVEPGLTCVARLNFCLSQSAYSCLLAEAVWSLRCLFFISISAREILFIFLGTGTATISRLIT